jgi:hypothetical protein
VNKIDLDIAKIFDSGHSLDQDLLSAFELADGLTVTIAGIVFGAIPTAIASENSRASIKGRESATFTTKMKAVGAATILNSRREKFDNPTSNAV